MPRNCHWNDYTSLCDVENHVCQPMPFSLGRCLTLEERVERLERMREDALAVVEARELEGIDKMPVSALEEIEEEDDVVQDHAIVETPVST